MKTTTKVLFHRKFQAVAMVAAAGSTLFLGSFTQPNPSLQLEFTKVQKKGTLYISVCSNAAEWSDNGKFNFKHKVAPNQVNDLQIVTVPNGEYAIALFQDLNGNQKLDTNLFGKPTEPYAFSNNQKPVFMEPSFEKCKFQFNNSNQKISISLIN
jgi:uncharacterized protein (DUF2141 family)